MKKQQLKRILIVGAISISIALGSIGTFAVSKSPIARLLIRDAVVATIAHHKVREKTLFNEEYGEFMSSNSISNSLWILDYSQIIVPFFKQENIRETPVYPRKIIIESRENQKKFLITGVAYYENRDIVIFLHKEKQIKSRQLLPVLVHEHVHLQGGRFIGDEPPWADIVLFESNTQAATLEVLAAMCYSGDDLACDAFWSEIENYASGTFWMHLRSLKLLEWYQSIGMLLWPSEQDFQYASDRFLYNYLQYPWNQIIIPGIMGEPLDTGNFYDYEVSDRNYVCRRLFMPFDDTEYLLGLLDQFIEWITPD